MKTELISRLELLSKFTTNSKGERIPEKDCDNFPISIPISEIKEIIRNIPAVELSAKCGKWIKEKDDLCY